MLEISCDRLTYSAADRVPMQRSQLGSIPGSWGIQMNFYKAFFVVCEQFASLHCVFVKNGRFQESCNMYLCIKDRPHGK